MRIYILLATMVAAVAALPAEPKMLEPGELALTLDEEAFEDYLDEWLAKEEPTWVNASRTETRNGNGCVLRVNGGDLGQPQPVYIHKGTFLSASNNIGEIFINSGDDIRIACTGSNRLLRHPNADEEHQLANVRCVQDNIISAENWLSGYGYYGDLVCSMNPADEAVDTGERCYNNGLVIKIGYTVDGVFHTWFHSCFDQERLEVYYVWYDQTETHTIHQTGVARPGWKVGNFFRGYGVNNLYTMVQQKETVAGIVGQELADEYMTTRQFLARGHLAAKSDFVFASGQRSSFYFVNAAPQWQPFNAGNWNWLEQNLRARIGQARYNAVIYTGTFGVTQLRDMNGNLQDIYLHQTEKKLPVPLYFYKVAYDASRRIGTAFVSINNPYYTAAEVRSLQFCTDRCRNNNAFNWLHWQPDRIDIGYSFCCTIEDFQRVVPHLPHLNANGLLA